MQTDRGSELEQVIERYNTAWNEHDVDRIVELHEWTATPTDRDGRRLEWDGVDVFPLRDGLILRKDVYSAAQRPRILDA